MLRGLNDKYRHCIATITSHQPPHTFLTARSFLLLEELYANQHNKLAAQQAMVAQGVRVPLPTGGSSSNTTAPPSVPAPAGHTSSTPPSGNGNGNGNGAPAHNTAAASGGSTLTPRHATFPNTPWAAAYNPWQGMV
jgi:hypothetical protein